MLSSIPYNEVSSYPSGAQFLVAASGLGNSKASLCFSNGRLIVSIKNDLSGL